MAFLQTIKENVEGYTKKVIAATKFTRKAQGIIGHPPEREFKSTVSNNMIQKFPINASDAPNDYTMFGPKIYGTRGKTVRQNPDRVVMDYVALYKEFLISQKFVTLMADVMFVNGAPILIIISCGIKFVTVEHILTHTAKQLIKY